MGGLASSPATQRRPTSAISDSHQQLATAAMSTLMRTLRNLRRIGFKASFSYTLHCCRRSTNSYAGLCPPNGGTLVNTPRAFNCSSKID